MDAWPVPGAPQLLSFAARAFPAGARVLDVGGDAASAALLQAQAHARVEPVGPPFLPALAAAPGADALVCARPTRLGPLIPLLRAFHDALAEEGLALVSDLVWQTAPTPELMKAFAPPQGGERIRPIEGYEMQAEHAGFAILERQDLDAKDWHPYFDADPARKAALAGDARGAARLSVWLLRKA